MTSFVASLPRVPFMGRLNLRVVALVLVCAVIAGVALWPSSNLLKGRPWRTSSTLAQCRPLKGECIVPGTKIFFHTAVENNPFIEFDLGRVVTVSRLRVDNRSDRDLQSSAVPIVAQLSTDGVTFTEVARKPYWFQVWRVRFAPRPARYLRLTVPKTTALHLEAVELRR